MSERGTEHLYKRSRSKSHCNVPSHAVTATRLMNTLFSLSVGPSVTVKLERHFFSPPQSCLDETNCLNGLCLNVTRDSQINLRTKVLFDIHHLQDMTIIPP